MRLAAIAHLLYDPNDELDGIWSREQLLKMDGDFAAALERAFELGLESRASAAAQINLPTNSGPRFSAPLCPATQDGLFRSAAAVAPPPCCATTRWSSRASRGRAGGWNRRREFSFKCCAGLWERARAPAPVFFGPAPAS